jgi:hypothetical protein
MLYRKGVNVFLTLALRIARPEVRTRNRPQVGRPTVAKVVNRANHQTEVGHRTHDIQK